MGYTLEAVIGSLRVLQQSVREQPAAALVPLSQGLAMLPMTDEFHDAVTDLTSNQLLDFWKLPNGFGRVLAAWSLVGPVGYVEADFFGGVGSQRAALWTDGELTVGPLSVEAGQPFAAAGSPISRILRHLGVAADGHHDEFEAVGLGRHRSTEDWLP